MASMRAVADRAGVSVSTVSIVLSESDKFVSEDIIKRVKEAADALCYEVPVKKRFSQKTIAVILPVVTSSFFSNVLNGVEETVFSDKNLLLYYNSNYSFEKEKKCLETLKKQSLGGLIIDSICPLEQEKEYMSWLKSEFVDHKVPVVLLERKVDLEGIACVYVDNFLGAYLATKHLIDKGHRKIAHIKGNEKMSNSLERLRGYQKALMDSGIAYDSELVSSGDFTPFSGYQAMKRILDIRLDITAVFSANDQMAVGAIKAINSIGKKVPDHVAVIGFDNLSISSLITPGLSTIHVPTSQMGRLAAQIVLKQSAGNKCRQFHMLDISLIVRKSSDISATNEWELTGW